MITEEAIEQRARQIAAQAGIGIEAARHEARIALGYRGAQAERAQAAQREAVAPPRDALAGYEHRDRLATLVQPTIEQRQATAARAAQLRAQIEALDAETEAFVAPRRRRRQALVDELGKL